MKKSIFFVLVYLFLGATPVPLNAQETVIVAAGDIACHAGEIENNRTCFHDEVFELFSGQDPLVVPDAILPLGDLQQAEATLEEYMSEGAYNDTWGTLSHITFPIPGNHELRAYPAPDFIGEGYYEYWHDIKNRNFVGSLNSGYYSYELGDWFVLAIDSTCRFGTCRKTHPQGQNFQYQWLQETLMEQNVAGRSCMLAYFHEAPFSSGMNHGDSTSQNVKDLTEILYLGGVDVVLSGHNHNYERFAKADNNLTPTETGTQFFVVGTGGYFLHPFQTEVRPQSLARGFTHGVLTMNLRSNDYDWEFFQLVKNPPDEPFSDSGTTTCSNNNILLVSPTPSVPSSTITPTLVLGDTNDDGSVDGIDYVVWLTHYNQNASPGDYTVGNFNTDTIVDGLDYVIWLTNYSG